MIYETMILLVLAGPLCWGAEEHIVIVDPQNNTMEVDNGDNFTIVCKSKVPVKWIYPVYNITEEMDYTSEIHITSENREHPEPHYISHFHRIGAHYLDTGYYYCVAEDESDNSIDSKAKVYIYVNDVDHLLVLRYSFNVAISILNQEAVLPCRPTSSAVTVNLNENVSMEQNDTEVRFDPTKGFIIEKVDYNNIGIYYCTASHGNKTTTAIIHLDVLIPSTAVAKPTINGGPTLHVPIGGNVTLSCKLVERPQLLFLMEWEVPNTASKDNHILLEGSASTYTRRSEDASVVLRKIGVRNLTILDVRPEDQGDYVCRVTDHAHNINQEKIHVIVSEQ